MISKQLIAYCLGFAAAAAVDRQKPPYCSVIYTRTALSPCRPVPTAFLDFEWEPTTENLVSDLVVLEDTFEALQVLQREYYDADYGTWPAAIEWTAAVAQTVVTGTLSSLSRSMGSVDLEDAGDWSLKENLISSYFAQVVGSFYGQDVISLRAQAYDDILWVVLGWIEAIKFVSLHSDLHYYRNASTLETGNLKQVLINSPWYGQHWVPTFSHRARIFWHLGSRGWDETLCHGGMIWNSRLSPYKNAITNELWISASIAMYQHFPGDNFTAPWYADTTGFPERDSAHLKAAVEGYRWLMDVDMKNDLGLFVDGYHIDGRKPGNIECDIRDEMVYTYNQGVILTGQRGIWDVTGAASYLEEGHGLIQSVIKATGWDLGKRAPVDDLKHVQPAELPPWRGIGRGGILEERCDVTGRCSQDAQTFKGIFFHHLAYFCEPLEEFDLDGTGAIEFDRAAFRRTRTAHQEACQTYLSWVRHNAEAALQTRDAQGRFGMWWGAGLFKNLTLHKKDIEKEMSNENATDYRTEGTPHNNLWGRNASWRPGSCQQCDDRIYRGGSIIFQADSEGEKVLNGPKGSLRHRAEEHQGRDAAVDEDEADPNLRGRGRTVETQISGLALMRAYQDMLHFASK